MQCEASELVFRMHSAKADGSKPLALLDLAFLNPNATEKRKKPRLRMWHLLSGVVLVPRRARWQHILLSMMAAFHTFNQIRDHALLVLEHFGHVRSPMDVAEETPDFPAAPRIHIWSRVLQTLSVNLLLL